MGVLVLLLFCLFCSSVTITASMFCTTAVLLPYTTRDRFGWSAATLGHLEPQYNRALCAPPVPATDNDTELKETPEV